MSCHNPVINITLSSFQGVTCIQIQTSFHTGYKFRNNISLLVFRSTSQVVADFGCGEAIIAQSVANKVHSFDLVAKNEFVTPCNMAKVSSTKKKKKANNNKVHIYRCKNCQ